MDGAVSEVNPFVGLPVGEAGVPAIAGVARIRSRNRVAAPQSRGQGSVIDPASVAAIPAAFQFSIPARNRQPEFNFDIGIARRLQSGRHTAKCRQVAEVRGWSACLFRRNEGAGGNLPCCS
jgi:hypothetical protein